MPTPIMIAPAATQPVTVAEAKVWARVQGSAEDALISDLITQASAKVEELSGKVLGSALWRLTLNQFGDVIELTQGPVTRVLAVLYRPAAGVLLPVDPAVYTVDLISDPPRLVLNQGKTWPNLPAAMLNSVEIEFEAGYDAGTLPPSLRRAVLTLTAAWYDDRSDCSVPPGVYDAVMPYRRLWISA